MLFNGESMVVEHLSIGEANLVSRKRKVKNQSGD